jgi:hypothetical protein
MATLSSGTVIIVKLASRMACSGRPVESSLSMIQSEVCNAIDGIRQARIIPSPSAKEKIVNRLLSLLMLVAFAVQQFACCCAGSGTQACDHNHPTVAGHSLGSSCPHGHAHGDEDHDHDSCHQKRGDFPGSDEADDQSCPGNHSHQHHLCVGTHVFFVSAARFELPPQAFSLGLSFTLFVCSLNLEAPVCIAAAHYGGGFGPSLSSCPQRSALCVYRI